MAQKSEQREIGETHKGKRVEIYLEVDDKGATRKEIIPFVVGVLASLAGDRERPESLKDRDVLTIDRENFNQVMAKIAPEVTLAVDCTLPVDPKEKNARPKTKLGGTLRFMQMEDFEPERVARQVPELNALLDERKALYALRRRLQSNGKLADKIAEALEDEDKRKSLLAELGIQE